LISTVGKLSYIQQSLQTHTCSLHKTTTTNLRVADSPNCNYCDSAYEMSAHYLGECDRYASLRREINFRIFDWKLVKD